MTLKQLADKLRSQSIALDSIDLTSIEDQIRQVLVNDVQQRFDTATAPDGSAWPGLKRSGRPLVRTGDLLVSALSAAGGATVGPDGLVALEEEPSDLYWLVQNKTREFWGISDEAESKIVELVIGELGRRFEVALQG